MEFLFFIIWFGIGLVLMIFGEYWFTIRKGHGIYIDAKYMLKILAFSLLGPGLFNRIITELFEKYPVFLTYISYVEEEIADMMAEEMKDVIDEEILINLTDDDKVEMNV